MMNKNTSSSIAAVNFHHSSFIIHHSSFFLHSAGGGLELALRVDQEICGCHHPLSCLETVEHDQTAIHARAGGYFTRLEIAALFGDENRLVRTRIQHRLLRN